MQKSNGEEFLEVIKQLNAEGHYVSIQRIANLRECAYSWAHKKVHELWTNGIIEKDPLKGFIPATKPPPSPERKIVPIMNNDFLEGLSILIAQRYALQDKLKQNTKEIESFLGTHYMRKEVLDSAGYPTSMLEEEPSASYGTTSFDFRFDK